MNAVQKACHHCGRFSETYAQGGRCPWCNKRISLLDKHGRWLMPLCLVAMTVAMFFLLASGE